MSNIPVWAMGYALRAAGVPCAEEIAMMLCRKKAVVPDVPSFTDASYHIFDGTVLATPPWDAAAEPYAFVYASATEYIMCTSAAPFTVEKYSYIFYRVRAVGAYRKSVYDRTTNTWGAAEELDAETTISASYYKILWTSTELLKAEDVTVDVIAPYAPEPFVFNAQNRPTAFLYSTGKIVFQSHSVPKDGYIGVFADWDTVQYTSSTRVPWLRLDTDSITRVTIHADAIPMYTDYWFNGCSNLYDTDLPSGLLTIGKYMFYGTMLKYFEIPNTVVEIGCYAYGSLGWDGTITSSSATSRGELTIPDSVKIIGDYAFKSTRIGGVSTQANVVIGDGVVEIGTGAFSNSEVRQAPGKGAITIGQSVKRILPNAFKLSFADYTTITFANADGWWVSEDEDATEGIAITENAGTLIKGDYTSYYWNRSE